MFNKKDVSAELATSMETHLVSNGLEKQAEQMNKFAKALDYLNSVAEIFDELGLTKEAEATTTLLEVVAKKKSKKKSKTKPKSKSKRKSSKTRKSDPATKGLTSEKMVHNLAEKGWVFNADDDFSFADGHHDSCMCSMCMDADDDNFHFDTDEDASYHIDRHDHYNMKQNPFGQYPNDRNNVDEYDRDEKEQDLARMFHDIEDEDEMRRDFEEDEDFGNRPTWPATPAAKRRKENEKAYQPGGLADMMDDLGFEYDPRMY